MPSRRTVALAILLCAGTTSSGAQAASPSSPVIEAPRQVTGEANPLRLHDIPALAVDPKDPRTVVMAVGDARSGGCGLRVSRDAGVSWATTTQSLLPDPTATCIQKALGPVMAPAFTADGNLLVAMPNSTPATDASSGPIDLMVARTSDLGTTSEVTTVAKSEVVTVNPADYGGQGTAQQGNSWHKFPSLVVDPNHPNRVYVGWRWYVWGLNMQSLPGDIPFRPYFAASDDGGKTWGPPVDLLAVSKGTPAYGGSAPMLVVAPNGNIYGFSKELLKSAPPGQTNPNPRVLMFKSTDGGKTWETGVASAGGPNLQASPEAAVDPRNGNLHVVYAVGPPHTPAAQPPPAPQKVFVTTSTDEGTTWSEPTRVDDRTAPTDRGDEFYPNIAVAPNGRIDVAWHDFRNDTVGPRQVGTFYRGERYWDVYASSSTDAGATWSDNMRVTTPSIDGKAGATFNNIDTRGPIGLVATDEATYLAWSDSRATQANGDAEDAYFSRIRYAGATSPVGGGGSRPGWVWGLLGAAITLAAGGLVLVVGSRRSVRT